jgi:IstB-like ATP binding protein
LSFACCDPDRIPEADGQTFTDPRLAAAVVDRLIFRAHILEAGSALYRLRTSQTKRKEGSPAT